MSEINIFIAYLPHYLGHFNLEGETSVCKESLSQELHFGPKMKAIGVSVMNL